MKIESEANNNENGIKQRNQWHQRKENNEMKGRRHGIEIMNRNGMKWHQ
jgi:hypothetical protein